MFIGFPQNIAFIAFAFKVRPVIFANRLHMCAYSTLITTIVTGSVVSKEPSYIASSMMNNKVVQSLVDIGAKITMYHLKRSSIGEFRPSLVEQQFDFSEKNYKENICGRLEDYCFGKIDIL